MFVQVGALHDRRVSQEQERFDRFIERYNQEGPHQGFGMKYPAELYASSPRPYNGLGEELD
jgi:hypothetical protein